LGLVSDGLKGVLMGERGYEGDVSSEVVTSTGSSEYWSSEVEERGEKREGSASVGSCSGRSSGKSSRVTLRSLLEGSTEAGGPGASQGQSESPQQQTPGSDVYSCGGAP
jgi:hypothetical protein